jgi:hypothetical protein
MKHASLRVLALALAACATLVASCPSAFAQAAGGTLLSGLPRTGGVLAVGAPANYGWTVPSGMYLAVATISYALQSTTTSAGGGAAALRCILHHGADGAIDLSMASTSPGPTWTGAVSGEMTLVGRFSAVSGPTPLTVTCDNIGNVHSIVRVDHLQLQLAPVGGFANLAVAP